MMPPPKPVSMGARSNPGRDGAAGGSRLINCYAEDAGEEGKVRLPVYACDGFSLFASSALSGTGAIRGTLALDDDEGFAVSGTKVLHVTSAGVITEVVPWTFTATISIASPAVITQSNHLLKPGAAVVFSTTGALPTGITAGTTYYVQEAGFTSGSFQIGAGPESLVVNTSGSQSGTHTVTSGSSTSSASVHADGLVTMARNRRDINFSLGTSPQVAIALYGDGSSFNLSTIGPGRYYIVEKINDIWRLFDYTGASFYAVSTNVTAGADVPYLTTVNYHDGYFVLAYANGQFSSSDLDEGRVIDGLAFAHAESDADSLVRGIKRGDDQVLFGRSSTEFWGDVGAETFPFERRTVADFGCYGAGSVASALSMEGDRTDTLIWAATNRDGQYSGIAIMVGYAATKISTPAVDRAVRDGAAASAIRAYIRNEQGRAFYVITDLSTYTWAYDLRSQLWHEETSSGLAFRRIAVGMSLGGLQIVGDYALANLYKVLPGLYDASNASTVTVKHSNNNGSTWVTRTAKTLSGSSGLTQRMKWLRLGQSKEDGKIFQIIVSRAVIENGTANDMTIQPPIVHAWPQRVRFWGIWVDTVPGGSQTSRPKGVTGLAVSVTALAA